MHELKGRGERCDIKKIACTKYKEEETTESDKWQKNMQIKSIITIKSDSFFNKKKLI